MNASPKLKGRLILLLIVAIGLAPVIAGTVWYYNSDSWRPAETTNNGRLIKPPRLIKAASLPLLDGGRLPRDWFQSKWSLVYAGPPHCPEHCKKALYMTRQIRLALGTKMTKVQRLFIVTGSAEQSKALRRAHPDLTVVNASGDAGQAFLEQFPKPAGFGRQIWLVDPRGRAMMMYSITDGSTDILSDIKHLLRYSQLG